MFIKKAESSTYSLLYFSSVAILGAIIGAAAGITICVFA
jgi:hypothetical protein